MQIRERFNEQLKKVQALPKKTKRIIFWSATIVVSLGLLFFWAGCLINVIQNFRPGDVAKDSDIQDFSSRAGQAMEIENKIKEQLRK